jgi:tRNA A-37 threonylcarbamoyl transferase component Bud32
LEKRRKRVNNPHFVRILVGRARGLALDKNAASSLRSLKDPDSLFSLPGVVILKDSRTTRAACVEVQIAGEKKKLHVKRLNNKGLLYTLRYLLIRSRAKRLFQNSLQAQEKGISVPTPLAYLEERFLRILRRSFFISEFITDAQPLQVVWKETAARDKRLSLIRGLADFVADLHRRGHFQRDMKASNILVRRESNVLKFFVTDLDGAKLFSRLRRSHRVRDLARLSASFLLDVSATDRQRFLRRYLAAGGVSANEILRLSRDIAAKSAEIVRRQIAKKKYSPEFEKRMRRFLDLYPIRW